MLTVKCSACSAGLKLQAPPASGKVKCPKCGAVIAVGRTSQSSTKAAPTASSKSIDPNDEGFDFGKISFPSAAGTNAVSQFPSSGNVSLYEGPIPGDPLDFAPADPAANPSASSGGEVGSPARGKTKAKKRRPLLWIGLIAGVLVLVGGGIGAAVMFSKGGLW